MRIALSTVAFAATLLAAALTPHASFAHAAFPPGAEPKLRGPHKVTEAPVQTLVGSVIDYGNLGTTFGTGYTLIDQVTMTCKKPSCTITVDMSEQVGDAGATGNGFAVCALVDGNFGAYGCPYAGEVPSDYSYIDAHSRQTFTVSHGKHTAQVYLYLSTASANSDAYDIQYGIWTP
jgi:hypothetical protein